MGTITTHVLVNGEVIEENIPVTNLRMRSRKATLSDCACFLRPGLEVCVLSTPYQGEDSGDEKDVKPVSSIGYCTAFFYIINKRGYFPPIVVLMLGSS